MTASREDILVTLFESAADFLGPQDLGSVVVVGRSGVPVYLYTNNHAFVSIVRSREREREGERERESLCVYPCGLEDVSKCLLLSHFGEAQP